MGLLVTRGCIVDRSARKPGRLAHATVEQTLAHLRRQSEASRSSWSAHLLDADEPDN
jgi:hypothetical protein